MSDLNKFKKNQKNRFYRNPKKSYIKFGDYALFCKNEGQIELIQINYIKKKVKTFIKKKKNESDVTREKIWYFGKPNFFIQKKSKNSRMGKGKGLIERKIIRVRRNFVILEFKGIPLIKLNNLVKYLNKFLSVKFFLMFKYKKNFNLWAEKNKYFIYHEKYLYM